MGMASYFFGSVAAVTVLARTHGELEVSYSSTPFERERSRHDWRTTLAAQGKLSHHDHRHARCPTHQRHC
jgi:hypothetical protein